MDVRPLTLPSRWTVQPSQWPGVPWTLTARQRTALYGHVWNDRQWFVQEVTPTQVVLEAGHYFDWLLTNRLLTKPWDTLPRAAQAWVQTYPWSDPPTILPTSRIALATSGLICDRAGRWLFVQPPNRTGWFASAGGGMTPEDGFGPDVPQRAWIREVREELGIAVTNVMPLRAVASPWHDAQEPLSESLSLVAAWLWRTACLYAIWAL